MVETPYYEINGVKIERILGYYQDKNKSFTWNSSKKQDIFRRRDNFHGLKLKAMVEHFQCSSPLMKY